MAMFGSYRALLGLIIGLLLGIAWLKFGIWQVSAVILAALVGYLIGRLLDWRARGGH